VPALDNARLPRHVAIIMDGNGRWAQGQGRARTLGHEEGSKAVRTIVREARRLGVSALTLYAFSEQNWLRPEHEVEALMALLRAYLVDERSELMDNEIRLRSVGRRSKLPESVREVLEPLERDTAHLGKMILTLAISYGGREEIIDAARALAAKAKAGSLDPESIDEATLEAEMPSNDVGPVDLLIRTGGEQRISNFLLWGSAYAELVFTDTLWPDMNESDLHAAIAAYQGRERRFGTVPVTASVIP
jgi:undecaprenyl diphosphate synthase